MPEEQQTQDDRAQVPLEEQTVPRVIRLMETGRGWQPYSVQARIAVIIMTQMNVSQVNQPTLLKSLLEPHGPAVRVDLVDDARGGLEGRAGRYSSDI